MPEMTFTYTQALNYTEGRDATGRHLGLVEPGDIRDVEKPPDHHWRETSDEDRAALAARQAASAEPEDGSDEGGQPDQGTADAAGDQETGTPPGGSAGAGEPSEQNEPGE